MDDALLSIDGISKSFGASRVLHGVSLSIKKGEFMTFLGPSGCGKTTTLRIIAGFEQPDSGTVVLAGRDVTALRPYERDVHTVFQHYALFPHYNVLDNVAFGLRLRRVPEDEVRRRALEALALVKLPDFGARRTSELSGGQMQRIALARALIGRPSVLLLDEPLGALDLKLRKDMQLELKRLQRKLGITFVYVTHDQEEAMTMSDRIAVFNQGRIEQLGAPEEIYERPRTRFVADFLGSANVLSAKITAADGERLTLRLEDAVELRLPGAGAVGQSVAVAIRPERIAVSYEEPPAAAGAVLLRGALLESVYLGSATQVFLKPFGEEGKTLLCVSMEARHRDRRKPGASVWAQIMPSDVLLLDG